MREDSVVLFLDDSPERAALMYQRMTPEVRDRTIWTQTAEEAISVLKDYYLRLELVYLDHDLGGETYVHSGREDCGMEVIRFLEKQSVENYKNCSFIVHSWNISAGNKMTERLKDKGYRVQYKPFGM
jgi:hypothetical protein